MTPRREPAGQASGRRGTEQRRRPKLVGVRFTGEEYGLLARAAERAGMSRPALLREVFLRADRGDFRRL